VEEHWQYSTFVDVRNVHACKDRTWNGSYGCTYHRWSTQNFESRNQKLPKIAIRRRFWENNIHVRYFCAKTCKYEDWWLQNSNSLKKIVHTPCVQIRLWRVLIGSESFRSAIAEPISLFKFVHLSSDRVEKSFTVSISVFLKSILTKTTSTFFWR